jgi:glycosyltransferase involved in cell wall biosynthesis
MMNPRVLFVDHAGVLGGAELYLLDVVRHTRFRADVLLFQDGPFREALQDAGVEVEVFAVPDGLLEVGRGGTFYAALRALPALIVTIFLLAMRFRKYDVIFANSQKALIAGGPAAWLARRPFVWNLHDILTADHFSRVNTRAAVTTANWLAEQVVVNSYATRDAFEVAGGKGGAARLIYNGIDPEEIDEAAGTDLRQLRNELRIGDVPLVGVFSRLAQWKGQHVLLEAVREMSDVHVLLVGDAIFEEDRAYAQRLRKMASMPELEGRVTFTGFSKNVPALMHLVDVVCHTSTAAEPFGRVIVEGMLAGKPVIATAAGGACEIVRHRENGLLVKPGDVDDLRQKLDWILADPEEAARIAASGRRDATERFSVHEMVHRIETVLQEAANG